MPIDRTYLNSLENEKIPKVADRNEVNVTKTVKDSEPIFSNVGTICGSREFDKQMTFRGERWKVKDIAENVEELIKPAFEEGANFGKTVADFVDNLEKKIDEEVNKLNNSMNTLASNTKNQLQQTAQQAANANAKTNQQMQANAQAQADINDRMNARMNIMEKKIEELFAEIERIEKLI